MSESPTLGRIVGISMSIVVDKNRSSDCPDTTAQIILPSGFELVSGGLYWNGNVMKAGPPVEVNALVKAVKEGEWKIEGRALFSPSQGSYYGDSDELYVATFKDKGFVSHTPIFREAGMPSVRLVPSVSSIDEVVLVSRLDLAIDPLDGGAELSFTVTALCDAPNTKINVSIPNGLKLMGSISLSGDTDIVTQKEIKTGLVMVGPMSWSGDIPKGAQLTLRSKVRPAKFGRWEIQAMAIPNEDNRAPSTGHLRVYVLEEPRFNFFPLNLMPFLKERQIVYAERETPLGSVEIEVDLQPVSLELSLNQTAELTCSITAPDSNIPEAVSDIELPQGLELVAGELKWQGSLARGTSMVRSVVVKAVLPGYWEIKATAGYYLMGEYLQAGRSGRGNLRTGVTIK